MAKKNSMKLGPWAFYAALVLSVVLAFWQNAIATLVLAVLGIVVGVLNITEKEMTGFLVSCIAWMLAGSSLQVIIKALPLFGTTGIAAFLVAVLGNVITFVAPAAATVAIMHLYSMTKN
jgi:hypothetical protein